MMKLRIFLERKKNYMKLRNTFDNKNEELSYHGSFLLTRDNIWDSILLKENEQYIK